MDLTLSGAGPLVGVLRPPSDKSLTHRAYMLAACAKGDSVIRDPLRSEDCERTLAALGAMGMKSASIVPEQIRIRPSQKWMQPDAPLDCGNSGTTMRLLAGLVASRPLSATLVGDASLSSRPMSRIATPLRLMGANVEGDTPPLRIVGGELAGIDYASPVASAQVKSCILLAGLKASGTTTVSEPSLSRDHTERMLRSLGVEVISRSGPEGTRVEMEGGQAFDGFEFSVPADISSAAFFMVAATVVPGSELTLLDVGINPTRTGVLDVFEQIGSPLAVSNQCESMGEPLADLATRFKSPLRAFEIDGDLVPRLIDEIPVLGVLATQCEGVSTVRGAHEMRVKESDRIAAVATGLRRMGAQVEVFEDGFSVAGPVGLTGAKVDARGDHRIAMAFAVASLIAEGTTTITGAESIATSYPDFQKDLWSLCAA